jgi:hypothetical protein
MIALTDQAVRTMLETRFGMPAVWTTETVALMIQSDQRYELPSSVKQFYDEQGGEVKFPFCAFIRMTGMVDDARMNLGLAKYGLVTEHISEDKTKVNRVRMIPMTYPYAVKYYLSKYSDSIWMEKKYYGLRIDQGLTLKFPVGFDSNFTQFFVWISSLDGFDPPFTDEKYSKGNFYTGNLGFSVSTWIAEDVEIPLIQKIETNMYEKDVSNYLGTWITSKKTWGY